MVVRSTLWPLLVCNTIGLVLTVPAVHKVKSESPNFCTPLIIAHRGASGYVPEHTLGSYALAITMGADYVEPDLVMTSDGHLIARHDNELGLTTDVSEHPEYAHKRKIKRIDRDELDGWFTEDFTLAEIKTLRAKERIPSNRPGNARMDKTFTIPTFKEIIELVQSMQISQRRVIGVYPEIKHSTYFRRLGLPMEQLVVDTLHSKGYTGRDSPVFIQSFEINNLKELKNLTELSLLQLFEGDKSLRPFDQIEMGSSLTYGDMATPEGLRDVAAYATAVGPDKGYIIPRNEEDRLGATTSFVKDAHAAGLKVHPYTFRAENVFLPAEFRSTDPALHARGDITGELEAYLAIGIDGLFTDNPDVLRKLRGVCLKDDV